jgi:hypothetical protein
MATHNHFGRLGASFCHKKADGCGMQAPSGSTHLLVQDFLEVRQLAHIPGGQILGSI